MKAYNGVVAELQKRLSDVDTINFQVRPSTIKNATLSVTPKRPPGLIPKKHLLLQSGKGEEKANSEKKLGKIHHKNLSKLIY